MTAPYRKKQNDDKLDGWSGVRQGGLADEDQTVHAKNTHTNKLKLITNWHFANSAQDWNKKNCRPLVAAPQISSCVRRALKPSSV